MYHLSSLGLVLGVVVRVHPGEGAATLRMFRRLTIVEWRGETDLAVGYQLNTLD